MVCCFLQSEADMVMEIIIKEIRAVQELLEIRLSQTALPGAGPSSDVSGFSQKGSTSGSTKTKKKLLNKPVYQYFILGIINLFIFTNRIILLKVTVDPESILDIVGMRRKYSIDGRRVHCRALHTPIYY